MITQMIAVGLLAFLFVGLLLAVLSPAVLKRFTHGLAVNIAEGTHANGILSRRVDAAHSARHLLVKEGSDDAHIAICGAADEPIGVCPDTPLAAEDPAALYLLGVYPNTVKMVGSEAIDAGADVYTDAGGKVQDLPVVAGTYWLVGKAFTDCTGDTAELEVAACKPVKIVIGAATVKAGGTLAVPITHRIVTMTTGGAEALTLADGVPGQRLSLVLGTDGGDGTLTPATKTGFATIVFADAGDRAELEFVSAAVGWILLGTSGTAAPPVTT